MGCISCITQTWHKTPPGINTVLPQLRDKVSTFNMQAHLMHLNMKWTEALNPDQTAVDVSDQPVYALTKEIQLQYPEIFAKYFAIFGQLHIEQSWIEGSGLEESLTENKFSMIGLSPVVDMNNIKRARFTLQIILCALFIKLREAASVSEMDLSPFDWLTQKSKENASFLYWKCVIDLQIKVLLYVRSIREGNFKLHVEVLYKLLSWYFIYDHYNYARWLTIHWFDLYKVETKFPDVYSFLSNGNFSFQNSNREFSRMGLDQIHEQNNKIIKGSGGASDLLNKVCKVYFYFFFFLKTRFVPQLNFLKLGRGRFFQIYSILNLLKIITFLHSFRWTIQLLFVGKHVIQKLPVKYSSLKSVWIGMKFLLSRVPNIMKTVNRFMKDFRLTLTDCLSASLSTHLCKIV